MSDAGQSPSNLETETDVYVDTVHECKEGSPQLAAFLATDENLWVHRRFAYVQSRLILKKQDELRRLEENLDSLDGGQSRLSGTDTWETLEHKFNEYGELASNEIQ